MRRILIALLLPVIVLTGCLPKKILKEPPLAASVTTSVIAADAVTSPNGKLAISSYVKEDIEDERGLLYSIYDVQLYDYEENVLLCTFHIVGRDFHFLWSPDSKYVAATYSGRIWTDFSVLDTKP